MTRNVREIKEVVESFGYIYIDSYLGNTNQRRVIIQDNSGYKYDVDLSSILRGQGINFVGKNNPFSLDNISLWLKLNKSQFTLLENNKYNGKDSKLNLYCNKCKDYLKMNWDCILSGNRCGVCKGLQVGEHHNLYIQRPDVAKEWHPTLNENLTPRDVTYGSKVKVWWICPKGHEYHSSINSRTSLGNGCPDCANEQKESKLANELKKYILNKYDSKDEYKIFRNPKTKKWLAYDIYIFSGENKLINGFYIEIHGLQHYKFAPLWHKSKDNFEYKKSIDILKRKFAIKHGTYIEIDLRKIKTTEKAVEYIENILEQTLS